MLLILPKTRFKHPDTANEVPAWVIEVSCPSNSDEENKEKMLEYFKAGVKMVWYVYPQILQIWIHVGPKKVIVCSEEDACQAGSVVPGFNMTVKEVCEK